MSPDVQRVLSGLRGSLDVPVFDGRFPPSLSQVLQAFNRDETIQGSFPFQVVPEDDESMGRLDQEKIDQMMASARVVGLDQHLLATTTVTGESCLFFSHVLLPVVSRLLPAGSSFVHLGDRGLAIRGLQVQSLHALERLEARMLVQQIDALICNAH